MPYLHGVYTSESPTSVVPTVDAASCLPFVIGTAPEGYTGDSLVRCRNWQEFKAAFGAAESYEGADPSTLATFARQWYKRAGAGDALFYAVPASEAVQEIVDYSGLIHFADAEDAPAISSAVNLSHSPLIAATLSISDAWRLSSTDSYDFTFGEQSNVSFEIGSALSGSITGLLYNKDTGAFVAELRGSVVSGNTAAFSLEELTLEVGTAYTIYLDALKVSLSSSNLTLTPGAVSSHSLPFTVARASDVSGNPPIICKVSATYNAAAMPASAISNALVALDSVYEQFGLVVTVVLCPRFGIGYAAEISAKVHKFGSGWSAIALIDIPYNWGNGTPTLPIKSSYITYCSPRCSAGDEIVDASCVVAGAMAATDASAGGFPYVSPSNKLAYIDGIVDESGDPLFLSQPDVNDLFNANAVVSFLHNAKGWVVWGNNTGYYSPSTTDPKDRWISIRRTFCYIRNDFLVFGASRIDNPINKRQLDGVVNAYNQRLKGLVGVGAVNSASIALSDRNTAETLLGGAVFVDVRISPPPPMENLDATFEYDVEGFVSSLS